MTHAINDMIIERYEYERVIVCVESEYIIFRKINIQNMFLNIITP